MDSHDISLLRATMDRTTDGLPPLPDLAPLAVREGLRRRTRARLAVVTTAFGAATAGALGLTLLPGANTGVAMPAVVPTTGALPGGAPSTHYPSVVVEETPGVTPPDNPDGLPEAERKRLAAHQQRVAALLDDLLPATVTEIRPVKDNVRWYRITSGGETFHATVSVRPTDDRTLEPCLPAPAKRLTCEAVTIDGNRQAQLRSMPVNTSDTTGSYVTFLYGGSRVTLSVDPENVSAPVTPRQLLAVAEDPRFLDLVRDTDENPVEKKAPPAIPAG
ncbi:hypothetical protein ABZY16_26495 [Streptomyces sp. NPDC006553]|uniref:hypothetical protein n=1 Tax=unclassified Streptomyces TaxID=2593676 RepID=UPI00225C0EE0|nr:hypothetical protein [Streptomyces sp. NBC_00233]MCX5227942.1 hypothetical protein [Streptomyces sp. NBC_00233]